MVQHQIKLIALLHKITQERNTLICTIVEHVDQFWELLGISFLKVEHSYCAPLHLVVQIYAIHLIAQLHKFVQMSNMCILIEGY